VSHDQPIKLLIAEDEVNLSELLQSYLEGRGHKVTVARDGRTALRILRTQPFDVALLDIVMPEMDGIEVLRHIREDPTPPECIIITGNGTVDTAIAAMRLGAYDYVSKPYRLAEHAGVDHRRAGKWQIRTGALHPSQLRSPRRADRRSGLCGDHVGAGRGDAVRRRASR
jgi:DNA-binding NtrC family response regulator